MASPDVEPNDGTPLPPKDSSDDSPFADWSGRGNHVDFASKESVPLTEGRFLGHGAMGGVYETIIRGHKFAWKRRFCRKKIGAAERKEIEILKKLSHRHIIQLVGTYTHRQFLGLLLHPVAVCDLATLMEDVEAMVQLPPGTEQTEGERKQRLDALRLPTWSCSDFDEDCNRYLYSQIGCIVAAVEYLHSQSIRHKDLKPSNILLSPGQLWLTDFGSATDFSMLSVSATENGERGTPKYFAPEVAKFEPSGRAADIFSLGCILLEICALSNSGTLNMLREQRDKLDGSFQANLVDIHSWIMKLALQVTLPNMTGRVPSPLLVMIRKMMDTDPEARPNITVIRKQLDMIDQMEPFKDTYLVGGCCKQTYITIADHEEKMRQLEEQTSKQMEAKDKVVREMEKMHSSALRHMHHQFKAETEQINQEWESKIVYINNTHEEEVEIIESQNKIENDKLQDELQFRKGENVRLQKELSEMKDSGADLRITLKKKEADIEYQRTKYQSQISEMDAGRKQYEDRLGKMNRTLQRCHSREEQLREEKHVLEMRLEDRHSHFIYHRKGFEKEMASKVGELIDCQRQVKRISEENERLQQEIKIKIAELESHQKNKSEMEDEYDRVKKESVSAGVKLKTVTNEIDRLSRDNEGLQKKLRMKTSRLEELSEELSRKLRSSTKQMSLSEQEIKSPARSSSQLSAVSEPTLPVGLDTMRSSSVNPGAKSSSTSDVSEKRSKLRGSRSSIDYKATPKNSSPLPPVPDSSPDYMNHDPYPRTESGSGLSGLLDTTGARPYFDELEDEVSIADDLVLYDKSKSEPDMPEKHSSSTRRGSDHEKPSNRTSSGGGLGGLLGTIGSNTDGSSPAPMNGNDQTSPSPSKSNKKSDGPEYYFVRPDNENDSYMFSSLAVPARPIDKDKRPHPRSRHSNTLRKVENNKKSSTFSRLKERVGLKE